MIQLWDSIISSLSRFDLIDAVDIFLVAVMIYYTLKLVSKTRAMQVLRGIGLVLVITLLAELFRLSTVSWMLNYVISVGVVALVILFQPELRRGLERIGRSNLLENRLKGDNRDERSTEELIRALLSMAKKRQGALIVMQNTVGLQEIIETGTVLNADMSAPLLETLFYEGSALHDGAVIIQGNEVRAAGCFLPLTDRADIDQTLGTRHRAAVGMSEVSDALVFVVSEETGIISAAREGRLQTNLNAARLNELLHNGSNETVTGTVQTLYNRLRNLGKRKEQ